MKIQFLSSINSKKSASNGALLSVLLEPNMMSFFLARVKETFMRRQSLTRSPICIGRSCSEGGSYCKGKGATYQPIVIRPHERDDDAVFVAPLTPVGSEHLDAFSLLQEVSEEFELLSVQGDDADLLLHDSAS